MTATLAAQLDELMGKNRNYAPGENKEEPRFDDPDVCKFYLAGYCPNEMFTNTKSDLGICHKVHDIGMKQQYQASSRFEKMGYEEDFCGFLLKMQSDMDKKIRRHVDRLKLTQEGSGGGDDTTAEGRLERRMAELTEKINEYLAKAEALGAEGKVDESVESIRVADRYKTEREAARKSLMALSGMESEDSKPMEVCMVCGCFLIVGDAQQRIDEHMMGKQHTGFAKVRSTVEELQRRREERREAERVEREARRKEAEEKDAARRAAAEAARKEEAPKEKVRDKERGPDRDRRDRRDDRRRDGRKDDRRRDDRRDERRTDRHRDDRDRGDRDRRDRGDRGDRGDRDRRSSRHGSSRHGRDRREDREDDRKRRRHSSPRNEEAEDRLEKPANGSNGSAPPEEKPEESKEEGSEAGELGGGAEETKPEVGEGNWTAEAAVEGVSKAEGTPTQSPKAEAPEDDGEKEEGEA